MSCDYFHALGSIPGFVASTGEWRARGGLEIFQHLTPFLRPTGNNARAIQCPLNCGCAHEVVESIDGVHAVCVCEDSGGCPDIAVERGDLVLLRLHIAQVGREIARALNCRPSHEPVLDGLWQIGSWSADAVPVLLSLCLTSSGWARSIAESTARLRCRSIVLCADAGCIATRSRELLAQTGSGIFPLANVVRPSAPGRFQPLRPPEDLFAAFTTDLAEPEDGGLSKAFALIEKLEAQSPEKRPGLTVIFKLYCMDELPAAEIARRCGCSKTTVLERLGRIRTVTGIEPAQLRRFSGAMRAAVESQTDSRAKKIRPWLG